MQVNIQYKVILGEYDQLTQLEEYPPESYLVVEVVRHPEYRNVMRYHYNGFLESEPRFDVALLMLDRPVRVAPNVAPICLPPLNNYGHGLSPPGTLGKLFSRIMTCVQFSLVSGQGDQRQFPDHSLHNSQYMTFMNYMFPKPLRIHHIFIKWSPSHGRGMGKTWA